MSFAASPFPSMLKRIKDDPLESVMFGLLAVLRDVRLGLRRCVTLSTKSAPMTPGPIDFRGGLPTTALVERAGNSLCLRVLIGSGALGGPIGSIPAET